MSLSDSWALQSITKRRAVALVLLFVVALVLVAIAGSFVMGIGGEQASAPPTGDRAYQGGSGDIPTDTEFEIRTGDVSIESRDVESDVSTLRDELDRFDGDIWSERKRETDRYVTYEATVRVDSGEFENFVEWLDSTYAVTETDVRYEVETVQSRQNEVEILLDTLEVYDEMLEELRAQDDPSVEQIRTIQELTDARRSVASDLNELGHSISELEERERRAEVHLTFREERDVDLWPEDVGTHVRSEIADSLDSAARHLARVVAVPIDAASWFLISLRFVVVSIGFLVPIALAIWLLRLGTRKFGGDER